MASQHAENLNPYHFSFSLLTSRPSHQIFKGAQNFNAKRIRGTSYNDYLKPTSEFYCDRCDRECRNQEQLNAHLKEHVTCGRDGCTFTAHEKLVANHVRMQHATGIFSRIKKLENPEEIEKWLEERRRKYPTRQNMENKLKIMDAKRKRGEIIEGPKGSFNKDFLKRKPGFKRNHGRRKNDRRRNASNKPPLKQEEEELCVEKVKSGIPPFRGTGNRPLYHPEPDSVEEDYCISDEDEPTPVTSQNITANKALGLLMSAYDSDASDIETPSQNTGMAKSQPQPESDNEAPDEVVTTKEAPLSTPEPDRKAKTPRKFVKKQENIGMRQNSTRNMRPRKPTLLQRLLEKEVSLNRSQIRECINYVVQNNFFNDNPRKVERKRVERKSRILGGLLRDDILQERNFIMQCVRFIVTNNFFEDPKKPQQGDETESEGTFTN